jgi:hypothetical protein
MQVYEIVLDGELATDLTDSPVSLERRNSGGATILITPVVHADTLSSVLSLLESLGIGVTAVHQVEDERTGRDQPGSA